MTKHFSFRLDEIKNLVDENGTIHSDNPRCVAIPNNIDTLSKNEQAKLKRYNQDTDFRKIFCVWIMWIIPAWLLAVILILLFKKLNTAVLTTLLGTTTVTVLGLPYIVLKNLFPEGQ
jgi:hypothetical protein